jgi:uncharacterized protein YdhG (YjbR/CyaY superfamily)
MKINAIDEYIKQFPENVKERLNIIRTIIRDTASEAIETISYSMPAFKLKKIIIYFLAHKSHIGLYPGAAAIIEFKNKLKDYKTSKGAIQLPYDKPIPTDLIKQIVNFNVKNED